jgi:plastocyanin
MPIQRRVVIRPNPSPPPRVIFDPEPVNANPGDQIFWFNDDTEPHWPAPLDADGKITDQQAFMDHQIAPNTPSSTVSPRNDLSYGCSLHLDGQRRATERGSIKFGGGP